MMKKIVLLLMMMLLPLSAKAEDRYSMSYLKKVYEEGKYLHAWDGFYNLATENIPEAIYYVGLITFWGQGQPQNYPYAYNRFVTAGKYGFADALYMEGVMELWGMGTKKQNYPKAYESLLKAEKQGNEKATILKPFAREHITDNEAKMIEEDVKFWKPEVPRQPK